jgi:transcription elongation factor Elf1
MCATCGCLTTKSAAPEDGTYTCVECQKTGKSATVTVKKGAAMPACEACGAPKGHWVKA